MTDQRRKYGQMEQVLHRINQQYISLPEDMVKKNNEILGFMKDFLTDKLQQDELFKNLFTNIFHGGSFFDGLKVGKPEEFDLDLILRLPPEAGPKVTTSNVPGFVHIQLTTFDKIETNENFKKKYQKCFMYKRKRRRKVTTSRRLCSNKSFELNACFRRNRKMSRKIRCLRSFIRDSNLFSSIEKFLFRELAKFIDDKKYVQTDKLCKWMESLVSKLLNSIGNTIDVEGHGKFKITCSKGGPAFTFKVSNGNGFNMDVDFVPSFKFNEKSQWPAGYRKDPSYSPEFLLVPKQPKSGQATDNIKGRYWRLSFQVQERQMLKDYGKSKPVIKLMKLLRDYNQHCLISSYYIKTVVLWEIERRANDKEFWNRGLAEIFVEILKAYKGCLDQRTIPYFWQSKNNLIDSLQYSTVANFSGRIATILADVDRNCQTDPYVIAKYLIPASDIEQLKKNMRIGKIPSKSQSELTLINNTEKECSVNALISFDEPIQEQNVLNDFLALQISEVTAFNSNSLNVFSETKSVSTTPQLRNDVDKNIKEVCSCNFQIINKKLDLIHDSLLKSNEQVLITVQNILQKCYLLEEKYTDLEQKIQKNY